MGSIRPLERDDLEPVAALYELVARSGERRAAPGLVAYFQETLFDHPWADAEIPSLVYIESDGTITGFLGSSVRKFQFDGRTVRIGVSGQLVTDPGARARAPGAFLMRAYMNGSQELAVTDTASDLVRRIWEGIGGTTFHLACVGWVRVFRPLQFASGYRHRAELLGAPGSARQLLGALDTVGGLAARRLLRPASGKTVSEPLTPEAAVEHLPEVAAPFRLRPAYDGTYLTWLFRALSRVEARGAVRARLVRSAGRVIGWYVYFLQEGGVSQVLQIAAEERNVGQVLDDLFHDAYVAGAAAVQGRVEPHLLRELAGRRVLLHPSGYLSLVHGRDAELLHAIHVGQALLTRLDGEFWMGHHLVRFG